MNPSSISQPSSLNKSLPLIIHAVALAVLTTVGSNRPTAGQASQAAQEDLAICRDAVNTHRDRIAKLLAQLQETSDECQQR